MLVDLRKGNREMISARSPPPPTARADAGRRRRRSATWNTPGHERGTGPDGDGDGVGERVDEAGSGVVVARRAVAATVVPTRRCATSTSGRRPWSAPCATPAPATRTSAPPGSACGSTRPSGSTSASYTVSVGVPVRRGRALPRRRHRGRGRRADAERGDASRSRTRHRCWPRCASSPSPTPRPRPAVLAAAADCELGPVVTIVEGGGGAAPVLKGGAGMRMAMAAPIEAGTEVVDPAGHRHLRTVLPMSARAAGRRTVGQNEAAKRSAGPAVTAGSRPCDLGQDLGGEEVGGDQLLVEELGGEAAAVAGPQRGGGDGAAREHPRPGHDPGHAGGTAWRRRRRCWGRPGRWPAATRWPRAARRTPSAQGGAERRPARRRRPSPPRRWRRWRRRTR